jgi:hypothetical protein
MIILLAPHPTGGGAYGAIEDDRNGAYIVSPLAVAQPPFGSLRADATRLGGSLTCVRLRTGVMNLLPFRRSHA